MRLTLFALFALVSGCGVSPTGDRNTKIGERTPDCPAGEVSTAALTDGAALVTQDLGINIGLADRTCQHPGVDCQPMAPEQGKLAEAFLASLTSELGRYPRAFLRRYGPSRIWLVDDLKMEDVAWEAGGVAFADGTIYLNVKTGCTPIQRSLVIHHEFFHVLDGQLLVNAQWKKAWADMNPAGFSYGADYNKIESYELHAQEGFATTYATTNAFEDRAETFAYAVVRDLAPLLQGWMKDDDYLAKKEALLEYWLRYKWPELDGFLADYAK